MSEDPSYLRSERPKGILRWEIDVPAKATNDKARIVKYAYTVDFARDFRLTAAGASAAQQQREFEELQRGRLAH